MKYYLDTEFHEYEKTTGIFRKAKTPTIDLISIGIVAEDGREYYAISKAFDLNAAWNKWQPKYGSGSDSPRFNIKEYWIRENVLKPIFDEMVLLSNKAAINQNHIIGYGGIVHYPDFTLKNFKKLLKRFGKSREEIADDIIKFCWKKVIQEDPLNIESHPMPIQFYAYYADYDWVVFCWLFGRMIDLPEGFPMYCIDLKQIFDEKTIKLSLKNDGDHMDLKAHTHYPTQENEHNALDDAKWNKRLHYFILSIDEK